MELVWVWVLATYLGRLWSPSRKLKLPVGLLGAADAALMAAAACKHNQQRQRSQKRTETGCRSVLQRALREQRISGVCGRLQSAMVPRKPVCPASLCSVSPILCATSGSARDSAPHLSVGCVLRQSPTTLVVSSLADPLGVCCVSTWCRARTTLWHLPLHLPPPRFLRAALLCLA